MGKKLGQSEKTRIAGQSVVTASCYLEPKHRHNFTVMPSGSSFYVHQSSGDL